MEKRKLGQSSLSVSTMGLGGMSLGTNIETAKSIIDEALELGINYLDTADLYDYGQNEEIIGKAIKGKRDQVILATKAGNRFTPGKEGWEWDPSKAHIKSAVKNSLSRLSIDYIDLYQLHGGTIDDPIDETISAFEELKREGYIREYGLSSIRPNVIKEYAERSGIVSIMMQYSILDRRPEELFPYLEEKQISVVTRGSLAKGILTNRALHQVKAAKDGYLSYSSKELAQLRDILQQNYGHTNSLNGLAYHYCLSHSPVASVVAGASSIEQIRQNVKAITDESLAEKELENIARITKNDVYEQHRM
ncbi:MULTISPECIES: aldo/keto reductase [Bacillaceae]|uniref:Oxidoreductase n=2 Tax=Bacillaceae TaxID=186817 RepID=A0A9D5DP03_9BACI|nr:MULTISPECIES: aldo/keto reductase [Bacillaceae]KQL57596.1 oxidoreductase [Alkalicoccobacillus plakortidis]MBG9784019.1 oxidoreductase [Shouchella lehensis]TES51006.1 aldo/keto reductase [Shouchella lehensis]